MSEAAAPSLFRVAVAEDLLGLARLCFAELDDATIAALREACFPESLGLPLTGEDGERARALMAQATAALPVPEDRTGLDELAADFGAIFLTNGYEAPASESPWIDDDHLERQQPTQDVAAWYAHHGYAPFDALRRPEDFIAFELAFLAHLLAGEGTDDAALKETARFLDTHVLTWVPEFAARIPCRCATPFYAGLAAVIATYLKRLRGVLRDLGHADCPPFAPIARPATNRPCD